MFLRALNNKKLTMDNRVLKFLHTSNVCIESTWKAQGTPSGVDFDEDENSNTNAWHNNTAMNCYITINQIPPFWRATLSTSLERTYWGSLASNCEIWWKIPCCAGPGKFSLSSSGIQPRLTITASVWRACCTTYIALLKIAHVTIQYSYNMIW